MAMKTKTRALPPGLPKDPPYPPNPPGTPTAPGADIPYICAKPQTTRAATKLRIQIVRSESDEWFLRIKRSGGIVFNSETYRSKRSAMNVAKNLAGLSQMFVIES